MYKYQGIAILMILAFLMVGLFKEAPDIFLSIICAFLFWFIFIPIVLTLLFRFIINLGLNNKEV